jgi:ABC-type multidrug transport system ATPase subunit
MCQGHREPAIEIRDLRKVYGDKAAVDGLTLTVPQGCFFGFLGPNGAGKTTTIKMLMGLAPPTSGTIQLLGLPMPERSLEIKQQIGLVPDESMLFDHLTGGEFIEFVGRIYGLDRTLGGGGGGEVRQSPEEADRGIFERYAQARCDGRGPDPPAEAVSDG